MNQEIPCVTRNDHLMGAAGEIPLNECWCELWVEDERQEDAEQLVKAALSQEYPSGPAWACSNCGQENEHQFSACWNCGQEAS